MKIVMLHFTFPEYTMSLSNALADHADLTLIHPEKITNACQQVADSRLQIRAFTKPRLRSLANIRAMNDLANLIKSEKPDLVHLQSSGEFWFELSLLVKHLPPLVTTVHDVFPHPGDLRSFSVPGSKYTARIPHYRSRQLIVHNALQEDDLVKKLGVNSSLVNLVALGECGSVYRAWAGGDPPVIREPYTLLFFGRIWPYKGLRYLLDAMPLVSEHFPDVKLIIAGRGESLSNYFPNGIDRQRYEIIDGFIPNQDVAALFKRCTAVIAPYVEASQSGVAAIAYGLGTPVIASNTGGLGELVRDGEDGLLVTPGDTRALADTIIRLLSSADLQRQIAAGAMARCQNDLNWSNIAKDTVRVYERALEAN